MKMNIDIPNSKIITDSNWSKERSIMEKSYREINNQIEKIFIKGLSLKGFEFETKDELIRFVKYHCKCEGFPYKGERIYYVKKIPFLLHKYKEEFKLVQPKENEHTFNVMFGSFAYL